MPLVPLREQHRLAIVQPQLMVLRALGYGEFLEHVFVIDDAVLENLDERRAAVRVRGFQHVGQILRHVKATRHEPRAGTQRKSARRGGPVDRSIRRRRAGRANAAGRRILALGQAINLVVEQHDLAIEIAAQQVHRVVAANRQRVAVAGDDPDIEVRIGELHPRRHRRRAAVDGVEAVSFHIIRKARRAADAADEHRVFRRPADFRHGALHRLQYRIIAATGAPADFLIGFPILGGGRFDGGHVVHAQRLLDGGFDFGNA